MTLAVLLNVEQWDLSAPDEQAHIATRVEDAMDGAVRYLGLERYALGEQEHTVAMFAVHDVRFVLIPGYVGRLGFDSERAYALLLPKSGKARHGDSTGDNLFRDFLEWGLTPPREVILRPFLLEVQPVSWARTYQNEEGRTVYLKPARRAEIAQLITEEGFRFPISDEWEFAASGGARTLFRWGDVLPPIPWRRPDRRAPGTWDLDQQPNAFGLQIAQNPWNLEYCAEPDVLRGGDGGTAHSQGAGYAEEWAPLASAFHFPTKPSTLLHRPYVRRALSVPDTVWAEA
ncbi:MAG TPA: hypothetical protein VGP82_07145 [Ktedonobacterales bacterium]|jgi:formylglycine-generating enzyme required for sulfatase activity|nr:hypothetical protein [Ktedonobacterales bacterium]